MGGSSRDYKASISFPNPPTVRPMKKRNSAFSTDLGDMVTHGWIFNGLDDGAESKNCLCAWASWKKGEHYPGSYVGLSSPMVPRGNFFPATVKAVG